MENGTQSNVSTPEENHPENISSKSLMPGVLMFLGVIVATLSVIVAGYFKGNMHIEAVYKSLTNFT
mgnify:FL=1|jgi:hypothetical protein